ncbi:MAG: aminotransferase class V-fold PLP-dependent enzyme [bacterium]|nr:aminotransferase class V-fold PLP-dependent enzyme [bacterium]
MNNAATSYPKPASVIKAVTAYLSRQPSHASRTGFKTGSDDIISACRNTLAAFFNIRDAKRLIFTSGSTEALNLAILGMARQYKGGHIVTTQREHNSVYRPLKRLERDGVIELTIVECDACGNVAPGQIRGALKTNTRAVVVNHCSNVTGLEVDLTGIAAVAHAAGALFIVDASQSAGAIHIDVAAAGIDMMAFTAHKSLYGINGTGGLYIAENCRPTPLKVGGTGVRSDLLTQPEEMPTYYEAGTQNLVGLAALKAGLDFIESTGLQTIRQKKESLTATIFQQLEEAPGLVFYGRANPTQPAPLASFNIKGMPPADVAYILENSFDISVRSGLHCAPLIHKALGSYPGGCVRVSPSYFSTQEEVDSFIAAVKQIATANKNG